MRNINNCRTQIVTQFCYGRLAPVRINNTKSYCSQTCNIRENKLDNTSVKSSNIKTVYAFLIFILVNLKINSVQSVHQFSMKICCLLEYMMHTEDNT